jgi:hypothetical protein
MGPSLFAGKNADDRHRSARGLPPSPTAATQTAQHARDATAAAVGSTAAAAALPSTSCPAASPAPPRTLDTPIDHVQQQRQRVANLPDHAAQQRFADVPHLGVLDKRLDKASEPARQAEFIEDDDAVALAQTDRHHQRRWFAVRDT